MPFEVGQFVSDYEILGVLGKGGMGAVYRVRNVISNRVEAMKVLLADVGAQADLSDRFVSEIRTLARLEHPNIAKFHTAFKAENQLVMAMEFVEGSTLADFAQQGAIPIDQVLSYVNQTLSALTCAHSNGVVHRDIKPSNIMVTPHGVVKLMDFGIAKSNADVNLTRPGTTIGSMLYMSPEQVRGTTVDARSDLYSLGLVLYELTAGKRPFEAETTFAILDAHLNVPPRPPIELNPQLPQTLNDIILIAIEKDPSRRFQTAAAFHAALDNVRQKPGSLPGPGRVGSQRDLAATLPTPVPYARTVAETPQQSFGSKAPLESRPQAQGVGAPPVYVQPAPAGKKGNRALWMAAGAIACVCVLGAAIYTLPTFLRSPSAHSSSKTDSAPSHAVVTPKETGPATSAIAATSAPIAPAAHPAAAVELSARLTAKPSSVRRTEPIAKASPPAEAALAPPPAVPTATQPLQPAPQAGISQQDMDKASEELMKLRARADAVRDSLNNLRAQQASQGVGLRQDIAASASRMDSYLQEADRALQSGRLNWARKNMGHADEEITKIEAFFGR